MHMRATQYFHCGLSLGTTQQKKRKRISEKHTEIFLEFLVFLEESKLKKEKQKQENYLHGKTPNKQKKNREIFFGFLLILQLIKVERKSEKKQEIFLVFSMFFKHTRRNRENKSSMDNTKKTCEHRQLD